MRNVFCLVFGLLVFATTLAQPAPPLVDGNCSEYKTLPTDSIQLDPQVKLYLYQDRSYVWFCYTYPPGSFGTLDLQVLAPMLGKPINLHVSGQLGEWPADQPEAAPENPESDKWWNNVGWIANPVWINGMDRTGEKPRYKFKNSPARELQLSKSRFGSGDWQLKFEIRSVKAQDNRMYNLSHPLFTYHVF